MQNFSISPKKMLANLWHNRSLLKALVVRDVAGRYKGSILGLLWSFLNPVFMLSVYTFFLSVVLKARWVGGSGSKAEFALVLFSGLMSFNLFSECVNSAPNLVTGNVNYVKKVLFPLEMLPVVSLGSAIFHMIISITAWLIFYIILFGCPPITIVFLPLVLLPLFFFTLGTSWFLASLGVYLRDVTQIVGVIMSALMFLTPIFYPLESLPELFRPIVKISPLTFVVEFSRNVMIWGKYLDWGEWAIYLFASVLMAWLGFVWFQKTRKGFADVL